MEAEIRLGAVIKSSCREELPLRNYENAHSPSDFSSQSLMAPNHEPAPGGGRGHLLSTGSLPPKGRWGGQEQPWPAGQSCRCKCGVHLPEGSQEEEEGAEPYTAAGLRCLPIALEQGELGTPDRNTFSPCNFSFTGSFALHVFMSWAHYRREYKGRWDLMLHGWYH